MAYCTIDEVNSLFGDISDDITVKDFNNFIENGTAWIDSNLQRNQVPLPEININTDNGSGGVGLGGETVQVNLINVPSGLRTAAIYYTASDILLSLYHGEDLPVQYDVWFNKAQSLLDAYIEAYWNNLADTMDQLGHQCVKHSQGLTYNQKRHRKLRG